MTYCAIQDCEKKLDRRNKTGLCQMHLKGIGFGKISGKRKCKLCGQKRISKVNKSGFCYLCRTNYKGGWPSRSHYFAWLSQNNPQRYQEMIASRSKCKRC